MDPTVDRNSHEFRYLPREKRGSARRIPESQFALAIDRKRGRVRPFICRAGRSPLNSQLRVGGRVLNQPKDQFRSVSRGLFDDEDRLAGRADPDHAEHRWGFHGRLPARGCERGCARACKRAR